MRRRQFLLAAGVGLFAARPALAETPTAVRAAMAKAATFYARRAASHGGYVYYYLPDLSRRWGEGEATADQIWVQPPGTPTVGLAFLEAYRATGEPLYLDASLAAAQALVAGQLESGGWTNCIDFAPDGERVARYRARPGRGKNNSSLDDGQTPSALLLLMRVDEALAFRDAAIHEAAEYGLRSLLAAQFPNGGFPQVWDEAPHPRPEVRTARFPARDWRTEGRVKAYWDMYTLNDNVCGNVAETLIAAHEVYGDSRFLEALRKLGEFLLLARMPEPQPAWAQQYDYEMQPIWARKFEPPAIASDESQEALAALIRIAEKTEDRRYLAPIPRSLEYLRGSVLADGRLARFYELQTNRPLYLRREGDLYKLTYNDQDLPDHYAWKIPSRVEALERRYQRLLRSERAETAPQPPAADEVRRWIEALDEQGRWIERYRDRRLTGQLKLEAGQGYLSSETFSRRLSGLAAYLQARKE